MMNPSAHAEIMKPKTAVAASFAFFGLSLLALFLLTRYLQIDPGSPIAEEVDSLFSVDASLRWRQLSGVAPPLFSISHTLLDHFWGRIGTVMSWAFMIAWPAESAQLYAATSLVCIMAAAGFGCLALNSLMLNNRLINLILLFPVCLLFTANVIIAQPDHLGLSFGLLAGTTLALLPGMSDRMRITLLCVLGFLNAVTTATNVLFPIIVAAILFHDRISWTKLNRFRWPILIAGGLVVAIGVMIVAPRWNGLQDTVALKNFMFRLFRDPLLAARFAGSGLLYPAVGPVPEAWKWRTIVSPFTHQSYNKTGLAEYTLMSGVAACAWIALLAASSVEMARSRDLRGYWYAVVAWIVFNLVFHNIWGDEFFLYSAHWSWALMLIVLLGSRAIPTWAVALAVLLIIPGQLDTLSAIRRLLLGS